MSCEHCGEVATPLYEIRTLSFQRGRMLAYDERVCLRCYWDQRSREDALFDGVGLA